MKFRTENEFTHFKFSDVHVSDIMMSFGTFKICLDNVIIKADNSKNRDIRDMRTNGLILKLSDANIISFIREGVKTYDADGNLKSTTDDEEIEAADYRDTFNNFLDGYAYLIEKENENYTFVFDGTDERSYTLIVSASKDECEWEASERNCRCCCQAFATGRVAHRASRMETPRSSSSAARPICR